MQPIEIALDFPRFVRKPAELYRQRATPPPPSHWGWPDWLVTDRNSCYQAKSSEIITSRQFLPEFLKNNYIHCISKTKGGKLHGSGRKLENQEFLQNQEKWHLCIWLPAVKTCGGSRILWTNSVRLYVHEKVIWLNPKLKSLNLTCLPNMKCREISRQFPEWWRLGQWPRGGGITMNLDVLVLMRYLLSTARLHEVCPEKDGDLRLNPIKIKHSLHYCQARCWRWSGNQSGKPRPPEIIRTTKGSLPLAIQYRKRYTAY